MCVLGGEGSGLRRARGQDVIARAPRVRRPHGAVVRACKRIAPARRVAQLHGDAWLAVEGGHFLGRGDGAHLRVRAARRAICVSRMRGPSGRMHIPMRAGTLFSRSCCPIKKSGATRRARGTAGACGERD